MLHEVPPADRPRLRPLFVTLPGLHGVVDAALDGGMGAAYADDVDNPAVAVIELDFDIFTAAASPAAAASTPAAAEEAVRRLRPGASILTAGPEWEALLSGVWGKRLGTRTRVAFSPGEWTAGELQALIDAPGPDFAVRRIKLPDVARFAALEDSLVCNFASLEDFADRGVGFGIDHEGRFVSGCSSFAISPHSLEFEIQTHSDFRNRGLAAATAAAMIAYCLENGLTPCWDAHNETSARLAERIGFTKPAPYTAYFLSEDG